MVTSSNTSDAVKSFMTRHFTYGDQHVTDHIQAIPLLSNTTMRFVHDIVMHTEATRMAQLRYVLARLGVPPRSIKHVKTDASSWSSQRSSSPR